MRVLRAASMARPRGKSHRPIPFFVRHKAAAGERYHGCKLTSQCASVGQRLGQPKEAHEKEQTEVTVTKRFRKAILCVAIGCVMALAFAMTGCSTDSTYEPETKTPQV